MRQWGAVWLWLYERIVPLAIDDGSGQGIQGCGQLMTAGSGTYLVTAAHVFNGIDPADIGIPTEHVAGLIGVVVGFPALRIKGIYLLLLTLGFAEIISVIALSWDYVGGARGAAAPDGGAQGAAAERTAAGGSGGGGASYLVADWATSGSKL